MRVVSHKRLVRLCVSTAPNFNTLIRICIKTVTRYRVSRVCNALKYFLSVKISKFNGKSYYFTFTLKAEAQLQKYLKNIYSSPMISSQINKYQYHTVTGYSNYNFYYFLLKVNRRGKKINKIKYTYLFKYKY